MMHEIFREKYIGTTYLYSKIALCTGNPGNGFWVQSNSDTTTQQHYVLSHTKSTSKPSATSTM